MAEINLSENGERSIIKEAFDATFYFDFLTRFDRILIVISVSSICVVVQCNVLVSTSKS